MSDIKMMDYLSLAGHQEFTEEEMRQQAKDFNNNMMSFHSAKKFSDRSFPSEILEDCIRAAVSAPNEASTEPWHFVVISDPDLKKEIRIRSEKWQNDTYMNFDAFDVFQRVSHLSVDQYQPYLDAAPYYIAVFARTQGQTPNGKHTRHYFAKESVGMAAGILLTAIHQTGLEALVLAPGPAKFLNDILGRPSTEQPYLLIAVGYPDEEEPATENQPKDISDSVTFL